jgi:hypothetical protein
LSCIGNPHLRSLGDAAAQFDGAGQRLFTLIAEHYPDSLSPWLLLLGGLDGRATLLIGNYRPLGVMEGMDRDPDAVAVRRLSHGFRRTGRAGAHQYWQHDHRRADVLRRRAPGPLVTYIPDIAATSAG